MACVKHATWHERLAHVNNKYLMKTFEKQAAYGLDEMKKEENKCEVCVEAKSKKQSYKTVEKTLFIIM